MPGAVEYVERRGQVKHEAGVQVDVASLTLPDSPAFPHAVIGLKGHDEGQDHPSLAPQKDVVIVCCPNGYCWMERH